MGTLEMWDPYAALRHTQLSNGLSVYLGTWDRPWIKMKMVVHAGAKDDPQGKDGVAHFLEHLLSENVDGWTQEKMGHRFQEIGGSANFGGTGYNATEYKCSVPLEGDSLKFSLDLFGTMLVTCNIERFVERERQVILNEYMERFPTLLQAEMLAKRRDLFFRGTRLGTFLRPLGKLETIPVITLEDIREFYDRYYTPANISIVAVGGIELEQFVIALQNSPFGIDKAGSRVAMPAPMAEISTPAETRWDKSAAELTNQKLHQSVIELHAAFPGTTSPEVVSRTSNTLNTTFNREVREKRGWTYGFNINWSRYPEAYEFSIAAKFPWENLAVMEDLIDECIGIALQRTDVIEHHIRASVSSWKIVDPNAQGIVDVSGDGLAFQGHIDTYADNIKAANSVTVEHVQSILKGLSRDRRFTMTLHP
jgi:predicted Zn-dependent peptidase